jgi:hypothetical protein
LAAASDPTECRSGWDRIDTSCTLSHMHCTMTAKGAGSHKHR